MQRFASPLDCNQLDNLCTPFIPTQTKNNNSWSTGVFKTWLSTRHSTQTLSAGDVVPTDILLSWIAIHALLATHYVNIIYITVHRQDSICPYRAHAVLSVHCNIYLHVHTLYLLHVRRYIHVHCIYAHIYMYIVNTYFKAECIRKWSKVCPESVSLIRERPITQSQHSLGVIAL